MIAAILGAVTSIVIAWAVIHVVRSLVEMARFDRRDRALRAQERIAELQAKYERESTDPVMQAAIKKAKEERQAKLVALCQKGKQ